MGKTGWLFSVITLNLFTVLIVQLITSGTYTVGITAPPPPNDLLAIPAMIFDFVVTYFNLLFFGVPGLPPFFSLFFIVTNGMMFYVILK